MEYFLTQVNDKEKAEGMRLPSGGKMKYMAYADDVILVGVN